MKRVSTGIWRCTKCKTELAGGAYVPQTDVGRISQRAVMGVGKEEIIAAYEAADPKEEPKASAKKPAKKAVSAEEKPVAEAPAEEPTEKEAD